jgi:hypothetical protein
MSLRELFTPHYSAEVIRRILDRGLIHAEEDVFNLPRGGDELWSADAEIYTMLMRGGFTSSHDLHPVFLDDPTLHPHYIEIWNSWLKERRERIDTLLSRRAKNE